MGSKYVMGNLNCWISLTGVGGCLCSVGVAVVGGGESQDTNPKIMNNVYGNMTDIIFTNYTKR